MLTVVIDTDPGIDDALALLLAWGSPELHVVAVTAVAGNVPVETAGVNVVRLLGLRRPDPRPVVALGASRPLERPLSTAVRYHGEDGLGDVGGWPAVDLPGGGAVDVILDALRRAAGGATLVALGPLTNLAHVVAKDSSALARAGRLVVMGGAVDVPGNATPSAEFNMHVDPEAAARVLTAGAGLDLVPLDATRQALLRRPDLLTALARTPGPLADRIAAFTERGFRLDVEDGARGMVLHDPLAVGLAIDPTLATWEPVSLRVGAGGETVRASGAPNCRVARRVDSRRFLQLFLGRLCPAR